MDEWETVHHQGLHWGMMTLGFGVYSLLLYCVIIFSIHPRRPKPSLRRVRAKPELSPSRARELTRIKSGEGKDGCNKRT